MTKRKQPLTSIAAHDSIKPDKEALHNQIIEGMNKLRVGGNFDEISVHAGLKREQVWRRLSELEKDGKIFNTGVTHTSITARAATVWQLCDLSGLINEPVAPEPKHTKENPPAPPKINSLPHYVQNDLFGS